MKLQFQPLFFSKATHSSQTEKGTNTKPMERTRFAETTMAMFYNDPQRRVDTGEDRARTSSSDNTTQAGSEDSDADGTTYSTSGGSRSPRISTEATSVGSNTPNNANEVTYAPFSDDCQNASSAHATVPAASTSSDNPTTADREAFAPIREDFPDNASVSSTSSDESARTVPFSLNVKDKAAFKHLDKNLVVDAVSRQKVTNKTLLAALYDYKDQTIDNDLIDMISSSVQFQVPCQLVTPDNCVFPPSSDVTQTSYHFKVTFVNLVSSFCRISSHH
jgi:hypothetical protein